MASAVALLIVILSVMEGFRMDLQDRIRGTSADLRVDSRSYIGMRNHGIVEEKVARVPGVLNVSPYLETLVLHQVGRESMANYYTLQAVDLAREARVGGIGGYLQAVRRQSAKAEARQAGPPFRSMDQIDALLAEQPVDPEGLLAPEWLGKRLWALTGEKKPPEDAKPILVGYEAVIKCGFWLGQTLRLLSFSPVSNRTREGTFFVAGCFLSRDYQFDRYTLLMPRLQDAVDFLDLKDPSGTGFSVSGLRVALAGGSDPEAVGTAVREAVRDVPFVRVRTWREEKASLLRAVKIEKNVVGIILSVVILFAGFMIFIVLTVQVVEKTRDLGILQSLGATSYGIASVYFLIGAGVCLLGTLLGGAVGVTFALELDAIQRWIYLLFGFEVFPRSVYYIDRIPVRLASTDILFIVGPTVLASLIASVVPALRAARKDPVVALRYE